MNSGRSAAVSFLLFLFYFNTLEYSLGLRCYTCQWMDGRGDRECLNTPPPSRYLTECNQPTCWKKYSHYNGMTNVQRFCGATSGERSFCQQSSFDNILRGESYPATECVCKTEGCNGSTRLLQFNQLPNYGIMVTLLLASTTMLVSQTVGCHVV